jgi:hypothetical protein
MAKPSAGAELGLLVAMVKLSWKLPVEMSVGQTISPCSVPVAPVSW